MNPIFVDSKRGICAYRRIVDSGHIEGNRFGRGIVGGTVTDAKCQIGISSTVSIRGRSKCQVANIGSVSRQFVFRAASLWGLPRLMDGLQCVATNGIVAVLLK